MSFNLDNFGSDASNVKSIFGGVCYYRYFNKDNSTVTNPGFFPASLGLQLGDRITVIPQTKTNPDEEYIVTDITNRVVTVTKVEAGGSVDLSKVVNADVLPTASADNLGYFYLFTGATDASYTHGYIYECQKSATYTGTVSFEAATLSSTTVACSGDDFASFLTEAGADPTPIVSGTMTYDAAGGGWTLVGKDAEDNTITTFFEYNEDYVDHGFTFTGTPVDADVIAFTCSVEEDTVTYSWVRTNAQPVPTAQEIGAVTQQTSTISLVSTDWVSHSQTKTVSGVTADNTVIVSPASASASDYADAEILCIAQGANSLTFTCTTDPTNNISVNVVILN